MLGIERPAPAEVETVSARTEPNPKRPVIRTVSTRADRPRGTGSSNPVGAPGHARGSGSVYVYTKTLSGGSRRPNWCPRTRGSAKPSTTRSRSWVARWSSAPSASKGPPQAQDERTSSQRLPRDRTKLSSLPRTLGLTTASAIRSPSQATPSWSAPRARAPRSTGRSTGLALEGCVLLHQERVGLAPDSGDAGRGAALLLPR